MPPPFDLLPRLLQGVHYTLSLTFLSAILGLVAALIAGIGRASSQRWIRAIAGVYTEVFRGTSLLVQLFWIFYVLPLLGISVDRMSAGVLSLGLNVGAYGAEVVRGAILAVPNSQIEAGIALNMTPTQRLFRVILPQAWVRILPPFGNLLIELLKGTALVSLISIPEITWQGYTLQQTDGRTAEIFSLLLLMYFAIAYPLRVGIRWLEARRQWA
jgi:polar amino acid transport system permease protein